MGKKYNLLVITIVAIALMSCSAQRRTASRIGGEWNIEKFENRVMSGSSSSIENAGVIVFNNNGRGSQTFTTTVVQGGVGGENEFSWENTEHTVSIKSLNARVPKTWIIVNSGRGTQQWYSTDNDGNVQVMHLRKR
jgi:hypothetical protein